MIIEIGEYLMQILQSLLLFWYNNFIQNYGNLIKYVSKYPAHISSPKTLEIKLHAIEYKTFIDLYA